MFGRNTPRKREYSDWLQLREIFYTIQGEGPFAGRPATFIRLTGCNLKCWFCDTEWDDEKDATLRYQAIADHAREISPSHSSLAVLTGGEPMRQNLGPLIQALQRNGFCDVQIETAGSFWQECVLWPGVTTVISPKTAKVHPCFKEYDAAFYWKYVLKASELDPSDGLPSGAMQRVRGGIGGGAPARPPIDAVGQGRVSLQPMDEYDPANNIANLRAVAESAMKYGYNAGLQMHKYFKVD